MRDYQLINHIHNTLNKMALDDIKKASAGRSKMGAFILGSCFIDYLAGFWAGKKSSRTVYKDFVKQYLKPYDPEKLYRDLRCKLVHNYSEGGSYIFTDANPSLHQKPHSGKKLINLENFINDLEAAMRQLFKDFSTDPTLEENAKKRFNEIGLLTVAPLDSM